MEDPDLFGPSDEKLIVTTWEGSIYQIGRTDVSRQDLQTSLIKAGGADYAHVITHLSGATHFCNFVAQDLIDWANNQ